MSNAIEAGNIVPSARCAPMSMLSRCAFTTMLFAPLSACGDEDPTDEVSASSQVSRGFELPDVFEPRLETYVHSWGQQWPSFRVHGETAVFVGGERAYGRAWGMRTVAEQTPHEVDDAFEIGTLSVHLTHAAILALARDGDLDLDAPVSDILEIPIHRDVSVEHLLTMTSGLPNFTESLMFQAVGKTRPATNAQIAATFAGDPLEFEPGEDFAPSISNAVVLGLVLERVTERSYPDAVRQLVLEPLHMDATRYGRVPDASVGHAFDEDEFLDPVLLADPESLAAAGAWTSTAADLGTLYTAMLGEHFGTGSRRVWGDNAAARPYGFAATTIASQDAFGWVGRFDGHEHGVIIVPAHDLVIVQLGNTEVAPGLQLAEAVATIALGQHVPTRDEARPVPLDPGELAPFARTWVLRPADLAMVEASADDDTLATLRSVQTIYAPGEGLRLRIEGRPVKRMHTYAPRTFFFKDRPQSTARIGGSAEAPTLVLERAGTALHYRAG